ncbi:MAG: glycosyltransferase [Planctomycetes bacterium]|nr:glycosyltransferase [Planctomycetota bacterium]
MKRANVGKVDFHLHSYASNVTDYYAANTFAIPESYSDPLETYRRLKAQGMSLVTLTDHNSIDGVLEILDAGHRDVFISAEMTTTFPEDGCNVHVTVANMTEAQFAEIHRLRRNIYEMIAYVDEQIALEETDPERNRIAYFMTHPLMSTQNRAYGREGSLTVAHLEKMLLLCNCLEVRNGTRTKLLNDLTRRWVEGLDRAAIERLADKHGIEPKGAEPWRKSMVGGSDDHSGINPGRTWTEFPLPASGLPTANDIIDAIRRRDTLPAGRHGGPVTLAHAIIKLIHDGSEIQGARSGGKGVSLGGSLGSLFGIVFHTDGVRLRDKVKVATKAWLKGKIYPRMPRFGSGDKRFERILEEEAFKLLGSAAFKREVAAAPDADAKIYLAFDTLVNQILRRYVERITHAVTSRNLVQVIKETVALVSSHVFVSLPYFLSYQAQSSDRFMVRDVRKTFRIEERPRLVLVTDTFFDINGVARTIRRMLHEAERRDIDLTVVTCISEHERAAREADPEVRAWIDAGQLKLFGSVVDMEFPQYDELRVHLPPFLELLKFLQEGGFTKMQISTPGTIGLAGLMAAKLLQIETAATYHTSFPEYVEDYTKDISLEALTWKYMILFYHSVDEVVVPSKFIAKLLHERGLRKRKLLILDRWVDTDRFSPKHRVEGYWRRHGIEDEANLVKFAYVGRVSLEKNLDTMARAYLELRRKNPRAHLIVIGDGPFREELQKQLAGVPATFTGYLQGEELSTALASADCKLFPSTTDTWGNAPLEAQASGLPVVVSDKGGPQELMVDGVTGYCVAGRNVGQMVDAMTKLMDAATRKKMGVAARRFIEMNKVDQPFTAILDAGAYRQAARRRKGHGASILRRSGKGPQLIGSRLDGREHLVSLSEA